MAIDLEGAVARYLTCGGRVFISSQMDLAWDAVARTGGSCPDFVALDFTQKEVVVVEVTESASVRALSERIKQRETRWYRPLQTLFSAPGAYWGALDAWSYRFIGFVRDENLKGLYATFKNDADVCFVGLEAVLLAYRYWTKRNENGLPRLTWPTATPPPESETTL